MEVKARQLGDDDIRIFHRNEGHASLFTIALLDEQAERDATWRHITETDVEAVRRQCIFTTHTPVPAGHDQFPLDLVNHVLRRPEIVAMMAGWSAII